MEKQDSKLNSPRSPRDENVTASEVAQFDALASRWWDLNGPFKPLHKLNPIRLRFITDQVALSGKHVLDVGCGAGILTESLSKAGAITMGIDMAQEVIKVAKLHALESTLSIDYEVISVETLAKARPDSFDVITCMEMLEHVPDPESVIASCATLLKPGGIAFFSTINRTLMAYAQAIVAGEYLLGLLPRGTHCYEKFMTPAELSGALRQQGLSLLKLKGMTYNPLSQQFALASNVSVNYLISAQK